MSGVEIAAATAAPGGVLAGVLGGARFAVPDLPVWSAAVRTMQAGGQEARLLCIGDSVTQGYGEGSLARTGPPADPHPALRAIFSHWEKGQEFLGDCDGFDPVAVRPGGARGRA